MGRDRAVALLRDARNRGVKGFIGHRHVVNIGVDQRVAADHKRNMAFPEQEIAALWWRAFGQQSAKFRGLHVAVAGAGDAAGKAGGLDQAGTVDAESRIAAQR